MGKMTYELEWGKSLQYPVNRMVQGFSRGETEDTFSFGDLKPVNNSVTELCKFGYFWGLAIYEYPLDSTKLNTPILTSTARPTYKAAYSFLCIYPEDGECTEWQNTGETS